MPASFFMTAPAAERCCARSPATAAYFAPSEAFHARRFRKRAAKMLAAHMDNALVAHRQPRNAFYGKSPSGCVSGPAPRTSSAMDNHLLPWARQAFPPARESASWRWLSAPRSALLSCRLRERKGAPALACEKDLAKAFHSPTGIYILRVRAALSLLYNSIWNGL